LEVGCSKAILFDLVGLQLAAGEFQRVDSLLDFSQRYASVDQGAERHIATNSTKAIQVSNSHLDSFV
jgi:hypothetical protein